jgi:hypothetical protein
MEVGVRRGAHFQFASPIEDARWHQLIAEKWRDRSMKKGRVTFASSDVCK